MPKQQNPTALTNIKKIKKTSDITEEKSEADDLSDFSSNNPAKRETAWQNAIKTNVPRLDIINACVLYLLINDAEIRVFNASKLLELNTGNEKILKNIITALETETDNSDAVDLLQKAKNKLEILETKIQHTFFSGKNNNLHNRHKNLKRKIESITEDKDDKSKNTKHEEISNESIEPPAKKVKTTDPSDNSPPRSPAP